MAEMFNESIFVDGKYVCKQGVRELKLRRSLQKEYNLISSAIGKLEFATKEASGKRGKGLAAPERVMPSRQSKVAATEETERAKVASVAVENTRIRGHRGTALKGAVAQLNEV